MKAAAGERSPIGEDGCLDAELRLDQAEAFFGTENEGGGREHAGEGAVGAQHADGKAAVVDGLPGAEIEDVAVAAAADLEAAEVIAGGGDPALPESEPAPAAAGLAGVVEADVPSRPPVRRRADDPHVGAEVDEDSGRAFRGEQFGDLVDGELLADPSEVEVNRLDNQWLVRTYESEWRRWQ